MLLLVDSHCDWQSDALLKRMSLLLPCNFPLLTGQAIPIAAVGQNFGDQFARTLDTSAASDWVYVMQLRQTGCWPPCKGPWSLCLTTPSRLWARPTSSVEQCSALPTQPQRSRQMSWAHAERQPLQTEHSRPLGLELTYLDVFCSRVHCLLFFAPFVHGEGLQLLFLTLD